MCGRGCANMYCDVWSGWVGMGGGDTCCFEVDDLRLFVLSGQESRCIEGLLSHAVCIFCSMAGHEGVCWGQAFF